MTLYRQRQRQRALSENCCNGILNEKILLLVFRAVNWNPFVLCCAACVCKRMAAIVKRLLWKEFCLSRAPKMASDLMAGGRNGAIEGGWDSLAKLMFYCGGWQCRWPSVSDYKLSETLALSGHFAMQSRFSKSLGKTFLIPQCRTDTVYVTDACEHVIGSQEDDVAVFRGIFKGFSGSRTRKCLMQRKVQLERNEICPYCRARVWSMAAAKMVPRSAARSLDTFDSNLDYFVCVNGHFHGKCKLLPLSDSDDFFEVKVST
eukprot:Gb_29590 [translate_table: standard]